jgi:alanine racemase
MGRTGIAHTNIKEFIKEIKKYPQIEIEGIYTHLSSADYDEEYTKYQLNKFKQAVDDAKSLLGEIKYIHACASNGLLNYPNDICNLVRPGLILYGYNSFNNASNKINIKPICTLKSKITYLKTVEEGTSISYSRNYITTKKNIVATIPIGYADGLPGTRSNKGKVVINNQLAPIIGNICMDSIMVDVTHINNVHIGDDVYIWDNKLITVDNIAKATNTINYEILSTISNRVPRIYI